MKVSDEVAQPSGVVTTTESVTEPELPAVNEIERVPAPEAIVPLLIAHA
jgi:hypothetical protein